MALRHANTARFVFYLAGKYQDATLWLQQAALNPKRAVAYLNLGGAYLKVNRNSEARQAYPKYLALAPNSKSAPDVKRELRALPPTPR